MNHQRLRKIVEGCLSGMPLNEQYDAILSWLEEPVKCETCARCPCRSDILCAFAGLEYLMGTTPPVRARLAPVVLEEPTE
jgi:hypothetical protein